MYDSIQVHSIAGKIIVLFRLCLHNERICLVIAQKLNDKRIEKKKKFSTRKKRSFKNTRVLDENSIDPVIKIRVSDNEMLSNVIR